MDIYKRIGCAYWLAKGPQLLMEWVLDTEWLFMVDKEQGKVIVGFILSMLSYVTRTPVFF